MTKLCDLNCLGQKWQNCRAPRSCPLSLALVTGMLGQYRNKVPAVAPRTDKYAFMIWRVQSCGEMVPFIVRVKGLPLLCLKWMEVTVKDVSLISSCFHCNKLGLVALADCTVISPMRRKAWKARQNIALYKALWCFPGNVKSRVPNSLLSMGLSMGILRSNCLLSLWHADNNFWTRKVVVGSLPPL